MAKYGILNTTHVSSALNLGGRIWSVKTGKITPNGVIAVLGDLKDNEREVRNATQITDVTQKKELVLLGNPEVTPIINPLFGRLESYTNYPNTIIRGFDIEVGNTFEISSNLITALANNTPVKNNYIVLKPNEWGYEEKATITNEAFACQIERIWQDTVTFGSAGEGVSDVIQPNTMVSVRIVKYEKQ